MNNHKLMSVCLIFFLCVFGSSSAASNGISFPERIISLSPLGTKTIYLLGAQDRLVANTTYCNVPEEAGSKEKIGTVTLVQIEKILCLKPDLIISSPLVNRQQMNQLIELGQNVMELQTPKSFEMMCANTILLGTAIGKKNEAENIVEKTRKNIKALTRRVKPVKNQKIFIQIGINPLHSVNKESFINEYITLCRAVNIAEASKSGIIGVEEVIVKNPDVILIATMGSSRAAAKHQKAKWMAYDSINAVKEGRVYVLEPDIICSPTPADFLEGLKMILPLIYQEFEVSGKKQIILSDYKQ